MRLLVCQTPRLCFTKVVDLLTRELDNQSQPVDIVLFPELAMEHPTQCHDQGSLTFKNISLMMVSRCAQKYNVFVVLGSVEEYHAKEGMLYNTCVVISPDGEAPILHRKGTWDRTAGDSQLGLFHTGHGPVGILVGSEAEEEERVAALLAHRPCLVVNPVNAPPRLEAELVRLRPELQVAEWHQSFRRVERRVNAQTRACGCPFVRADCPLADGGSGSSMLLERHRSVMAPGWSAAFLLVETSPLGTPMPPGWGGLTLEDRLEASHEEGPRLAAWSMRVPQRDKPLKLPRWPSEAIELEPVPRAYLELLKVRDGRQMYAVTTVKGDLALWDVRLKTVAFSSDLGSEARVTAAGRSHKATQFIICAATPEALLFRVFDERSPAAGVLVSKSDLPWDDWKDNADEPEVWTAADASPASGQSSPASRRSETSELGVLVRDVWHPEPAVAVAVLQEADKEGSGVPLGLQVDLVDGSTEALDLFGVLVEEDSDQLAAQPNEESVEDSLGLEAKRGARPERLVASEFFEQRFSEVPGRGVQQAVLCIYRSSRICITTLSDGEAHAQILVEEMASDRERTDVPVCCALLPDPRAGSFNLLVGYQSMSVRWWQVSLQQCRLLAQFHNEFVVQHLCLLEIPVPGEPPLTARASAGEGGARRTSGGDWGRTASRFGSTAYTDRTVATSRCATSHGSRRFSAFGVAAQITLAKGSFMRQTSANSKASGRRSSVSDRRLTSEIVSEPPAPRPTSLLIVGLDSSGTLVLLSGRVPSISKVASYGQLCLRQRGIRVAGLRCWEQGIALLLSNGEVRHIEFTLRASVVALTDLPTEA